ncbi:hypothetical protein L798_08064 [Zootermopsis nevadensis]|uniref:Uncharacterized protein n=1 Tax=Zootermopsis nevadensis TaxID=136037 RepID=A0A067R472_ZOONE|nr:hypothetical protein L798_08064 [Zootermopsis nevadensis]
MPSVIMKTDRYFDEVYSLFRISIPIIILAINVTALNIMCRGIGMLKLNA